MLQSAFSGAKRINSSQTESAGPTPAFPQSAPGNDLPAVTPFASAKGVTAEPATSVPALIVSSVSTDQGRSRSEAKVSVRQGTACVQPASASTPAHDQALSGNPPLCTHAHSSSFGSGLSKAFGVTAPEPLTFSKNTIANSGSEAAPAALGSMRASAPAPLTTCGCGRYSEHKKGMWKRFGTNKKRNKKRWVVMKKQNPNSELLNIMRHASFFCREGAAHRKGFDGSDVHIGHAEGELAWLGTYKCASPRFCPLCGAAIAEKNKNDIERGLAKAIQKGWSFIFLTFTIPHYKTQHPMDIVNGLENARRIYNHGNDFTKFAKEHGKEGTITRYEETYGKHGWHPHIHEIMLFDHILSIEEYNGVTSFLKDKWSRACYKAKLVKENRTKAFEKYGFSSDYTAVPEKIAGYISKMGSWSDTSDAFKENAKKEITECSKQQRKSFSYELSSTSSKSPILAEGRTPWDIYAGSADGNEADFLLWLEYVQCFKDKKHLVWSRLLKAELGVKDIDEEEKVHADDEDSKTHIYSVNVEHYNKGVVANSLWMPILEVIENKDFEALQRISDEYAIDFRRPEKAFGDYPEILSIQNSEHRRKEAREREEMRRHNELCARRKEEQRISEEEERARRREIARLKAEQDARERARLAMENEYNVSLLALSQNQETADFVV